MTKPVWLWLDGVSACAARAQAAGLDWLSAEERRRLHAVSAPGRRAEFVAGRWLARQLLAAVHGGDALAMWSLSSPTDGPPRVERQPIDQAVHFSLSHSGTQLICAVSTLPVGVDIEAPTRERDVVALARVACTAAEQRRLQALEPAARPAAFYALWTVKEAWLKQRGEGASPARLRQLHARRATSADLEHARVWQQAGVTVALATEAPAAPRWHVDAAHVGDRAPETWCVEDRVTSP